MKTQRIALALLSAFALAAVGCSDNVRPATEAKQENITAQAQSTLALMKNKDSDLGNLLNNSVAYAVFPNVGAGGFIVGAASGRGAVYSNGNQIGWAKITNVSVGAIAGGKTFSELIVFHTQNALNQFKNNELSFGADAAAVLLKSGASKAVSFKKGIAVFTMPEGGAMINLSVGGQHFTYTPMSQNANNNNDNADNNNDNANNNNDNANNENQNQNMNMNENQDQHQNQNQ